jgi:hypothetical protein
VYDESLNGNHLALSATASHAVTCEEPLWREALGVR